MNDTIPTPQESRGPKIQDHPPRHEKSLDVWTVPSVRKHLSPTEFALWQSLQRSVQGTSLPEDGKHVWFHQGIPPADLTKNLDTFFPEESSGNAGMALPFTSLLARRLEAQFRARALLLECKAQPKTRLDVMAKLVEGATTNNTELLHSIESGGIRPDLLQVFIKSVEDFHRYKTAEDAKNSADWQAHLDKEAARELQENIAWAKSIAKPAASPSSPKQEYDKRNRRVMFVDLHKGDDQIADPRARTALILPDFGSSKKPVASPNPLRRLWNAITGAS